jgi:hypothetical protein
MSNPTNGDLIIEMDLLKRLENVKHLHKEANSNNYLESLEGTIGADPLYYK